MKKSIFLFTCVLIAILISLSVKQQRGSFETVEDLELSAYLGLWYETARIPNEFQDFNKPSPCKNTTAKYELASLGYIKVTNTCDYYNEKNVPLKSTGQAIAFAFDSDNNNSKLKVNFVPGLKYIPILNHFFAGDYWIISLGPKSKEGLYTWSVVVSPDFKSESRSPEAKLAWILSRDPNFEQTQDYQLALSALRKQKIDINRLKTDLTN